MLLPVVTLGLLANGSAMAQSESIEIFEEIVVLAQKRAQNIMEVPVAVSVISGAQIENAGIKDIFDLQQNVPSLIVGQSQTATTSNFSIRGIGSTSNNFGVESSVGLYVDGVYRSRQSSMINDLIDVEAVEVLRGPQGTLFGKNTPAGAISVRTVAPSHDRDAFVDVTAGDYGLVKVSAAANFPINDNLAMRGTIFSSQRDGYVDDIALGKNVYNDRDRLGVRLQFAYEPSDDFNMRIIADYAEIDEVCCVALSIVDSLYSHGSLANPLGPTNGTDAALLQFGGTIFTDFPYAAPFITGLEQAIPQGTIITGVGFEDFVTAYNFLPRSQNEDSGLSIEINKTLNSGATFTSITAYRSFETLDLIDSDFTNVDLITRTNAAEQTSFSQEFRLAGEFVSGSNYVVGAYYFGQEIDQSTDTIGTPFLNAYLSANPSFQGIIAGVNGVNSFPIDPDGIPGNGDEFTLGDIGYPVAGVPFLPGLTSNDDILQDQDGWAVFGQVDFAFGDDFILTLGARYTDETKDIDAVYTQNTPLGALTPDFGAISLQLCALVPECAPLVPPFNPFDPATLAAFLPFGVDGWAAYAIPPISPRPDLDDSLSDDQVTGNVKLTWFASDQTMFYLSFATGFKSGGTNTERISPAFDSVFDAETSESFEVGFKGDLGPVRLALTYYDSSFDDFQAQTFTGTGINLQNSGEIENSGIEVEKCLRPFDGFEAQVIYTHNEADYKSFEAGTCWDTFPFHTGIQDPGLPAGFNPVLDPEVCAKTGNPVAYNPEDRFFVALQQDFELSANTTLFIRAEYSKASEQFTDGDLDPFTLQDSFEILNARFGINFGRSNSSITLWGRNITDERFFHGSFDAPVQVGRMNAYPSEPSTFGISFRKNFD